MSVHPLGILNHMKHQMYNPNWTLIDPDEAIHPVRNTLTDEDWDRMDRILLENSDEDCTLEEMEAYSDWLYDEMATKLQTVPGTTVLQ